MIYYFFIPSEKSLATSNWLTLNLVNDEGMESSSICLETPFISDEFCMKSSAVVAAARPDIGKGILSKVALLCYFRD